MDTDPPVRNVSWLLSALPAILQMPGKGDSLSLTSPSKQNLEAKAMLILNYFIILLFHMYFTLTNSVGEGQIVLPKCVPALRVARENSVPSTSHPHPSTALSTISLFVTLNLLVGGKP